MRPSQELVPTPAKQPNSGLMGAFAQSWPEARSSNLVLRPPPQKAINAFAHKDGVVPGFDKSRSGISKATEITGQELSARAKTNGSIDQTPFQAQKSQQGLSAFFAYDPGNGV